MRLTIARKLGLGFALVIGLMAGVTVWSSFSVSSAVDEAAAADTNRGLVDRIISDHMDWASSLERTFVDNLPAVEVQTDATKCRLGTWLASEEFRELLLVDPQGAALLEAVHEPHHDLHMSAQAIQGMWVQRHEGLAEQMLEIRDAHRVWAARLADTIISNTSTEAIGDPALCVLGRFLSSDECAIWSKNYPLFAEAMSDIRPAHSALHGSVEPINRAIKAGDLPEAKRIYSEVTKPNLEVVGGLLGDVVEAERSAVAAQNRARRIFHTETRPALASTRSGLEAARDHFATIATTTRDSASASMAKARMMGLAFTGLATVIGTLAAWLITRAIVKPIRELLVGFARVGEKDLTVRAHVTGRDEIGELSAGFNGLVETLSRVLTDVQAASTQVNTASTHIASCSEELSQRLSTQAARTEELSSATEEMSRSISEVAAKGNDATGVAKGAANEAEAGGDTVSQTVAGMDEISNAVSRAGDSVRELGQRAAQIGGVVEVINDIADQTNLLALNAAIEAARAGEHGRGFAVVADEVRKLADRTVEATKEISASVEGIQSGTQEAVSQMDSGGQTVTAGVELAGQAGDALSRIVESSRTVISTIDEIALSTEQQASAASELADSIESIRAISEQSSDDINQAAGIASDLARSSDGLAKMVGDFQI